MKKYLFKCRNKKAALKNYLYALYEITCSTFAKRGKNDNCYQVREITQLFVAVVTTEDFFQLKS